jgi:hypothetical protein
MSTLPPVPRSYAAAIVTRTALFWLALRGLVAYQLASDAPMTPAARLTVAAVVVSLVVLEGMRRREALFHANLGVHPLTPVALGALSTAALELAASGIGLVFR